jgi:flagellar biosynthesis anti-sigma factor FlgM
MKVNDPNLTPLPSTGAARTKETERAGHAARSGGATGSAPAGDDVHLSELVRSLRSLAADSPERAARLEEIARSYASGTYKVDPEETGSKMIDDALQR